MQCKYLNIFSNLFFDIERDEDVRQILNQASAVLESLIIKFGEIQNELTLGIVRNDNFVDTVIILFIRKIMEQLDAINVLYSSGLFSPAEVVLRSLLETVVGLQFILKKDTKKRAAAYFLEYKYEEVEKANRYFNEQTKNGKEMHDHMGDAKFRECHELCEKKKAALNHLIMANKIFKEIDDTRKNKLLGKNKKHAYVQWYETCSNVTNFHKMMDEIGYGKYYDLFYKSLSLETHGLTATTAMHYVEDSFMLKRIRNSSDGGATLSLTCAFSIRTLEKLYHYLGDGYNEQVEFKSFLIDFTKKRDIAVKNLNHMQDSSHRSNG